MVKCKDCEKLVKLWNVGLYCPVFFTNELHIELLNELDPNEEATCNSFEQKKSSFFLCDECGSTNYSIKEGGHSYNYEWVIDLIISCTKCGKRHFNYSI